MNYTKPVETVMLQYFMNDPLWKYLIDDDTKRAKALLDIFLPLYMNYSFKNGHILGVIAQNSVVEAVTVLFGPDDKLDVSFLSLLKNAVKIPIQLGLKVFNVFYSSLRRRDRIHKSIMKNTLHWRITWPNPVIYRPQISHTILETVLSWAHSDRVPVYTEVYLEEQKKQLLQWGFEEGPEQKLTDDGKLVFYPMVRGASSEIFEKSLASSSPSSSTGLVDSIQ